jgi:hypothetical protein
LVSGTLRITPAVEVVIWSEPEAIYYGTVLGTNQLNAVANVPGTFVYTPTNGAMLTSGTNILSAVFTPFDTVDYTSVTNSVSLVVMPAPLSVTAASVTNAYGAAESVFTGAITGLAPGDNISATYGCSATAGSPVGEYAIVPSLVDPNNCETNYVVSLISGTLTITQAVPQVTWTEPAPIDYGAPLGPSQLNATANIPGSFAYTPSIGTALSSGAQTLSVVFTPADTVDYSSVTNSVNLQVNAPPAQLMSIDASSLSTAGAKLTMPGVPGQSYQIQASSNLTEWVAVTNVTADSSGTIQITDSAAATMPQRFYRAVTQ